jgi:hypothetical protein
MSELTVKELASMGGKAAAKKMNKKQRHARALKAGLANKARLLAKKKQQNLGK